MEIYLVGGAVRDALLGQRVLEKDWVVVGTKPEEMLKLSFKQVGKQFPVFIHPETSEEYALARTESKTSPGYHGFEFDTSPNISIEADLKRRDLTINAIAQDEKGMLIDPWGGQRDIAARVLRHVSRAFVEDPVRILRVARFAARFKILGFKIAPETLTLMKEMVEKGEVDYLVAERVWQETAKAFATGRPSVYLKTLSQVGALFRIAPEIDNLLRHLAKTIDEDNMSMDVRLFVAIDKAPKHLPEVLLAILSFYAYRSGVSISALGRRWRLPSLCSWMLEAAERFDKTLGSVTDLSSEALLDFFGKVDAIRKRTRFENFLIAYELSNYEGADIKHNINYMTQALDALATINCDLFLKGLMGKQAKERMRELQLEVLNSL